MKELSKEEETQIRNRLDEIEARMYHNITLFDDTFWMHKKIKDLLFDVYILKKELERIDDG